jgi:hypothetical protein
MAALLGACSVYEPPANVGAAGSGGSAGSGVGGDGGRPGDGGAGGTGGADEDAGDDGGGGDDGASGAGGGGAGGTAGSGGASIDASRDAAADVTPDTSPGPRDATIDAAPDRTSDVVVRPDGPGCAGYALQFDGFGYVAVNRPVQDDFTLEAWIKTTTSTMGTGYPEGNGVFYADKGMNGNDFGSAILNGKFAFGVGNSATATAMTTLLSTTNVDTGQWVHVAATRRMSTGEIQVFVNGALEGARLVATQKNSLNAQPLMTIGGNTVDFHYFVGLIDEVRAWNVVRTGTEITATMRKPLVGNEAGLVGYWRFDDGAGAVAADGSSTKNHGSVSGFAAWVASDAPVCP